MSLALTRTREIGFVSEVVSVNVALFGNHDTFALQAFVMLASLSLIDGNTAFAYAIIRYPKLDFTHSSSPLKMCCSN